MDDPNDPNTPRSSEPDYSTIPTPPIVDNSKYVITRNEIDLERQQAQLEIIQNMARKGYSPESLASLTGVKLELVRRVVLRSKLTPVEEEIADMSRLVMAKSLTYCLQMLDTGPPETKYQIATRVLPTAMKFVGRGEAGGEEITSALEQIFASQRTLVTTDADTDSDE